MSLAPPDAGPVMAAASDLAACLLVEINERGLPEPCFTGVLPGSAIPLDVGGCNGPDCDNGLAYVRVVSTYPSAQVGVAYIQPQNCNVGTGFDLEIGVFRCFPLEEGGASPSPDKIAEAVTLQGADERAMRAALACCDWLPVTDFIAGLYAPQGPGGGVLGGLIPVSAWIP